MKVSELKEGWVNDVSGYLYHGVKKAGGSFWKLSESDDKDAFGVYVTFWKNCQPAGSIGPKTGQYVTLSGKGLKCTTYQGNLQLNANPGYEMSEGPQAGSTIPQATQSPSAGSQTPSNGNDREKGMRDGMICNVMSRLVAAGKSVQEAHSLARQILAAVEGNDSHPELEKSNRGPQPAYPESEGGMPDGSSCPF